MMNIQISRTRRPVRGQTQMVAIGLLPFGALLVLRFYVATAGMQVVSIAVTEQSTAHQLIPAVDTVRSACSATGDLVGDANPADVARVLCADATLGP